MTKHIRIRGVRRKQIDEDKLALAFLLLSKSLHDNAAQADEADSDEPVKPEAA